jgi:hypothetical protein
MVIRFAIVWFWIVGGLVRASTPPVHVPLVSVDVSDFKLTYEGNKIDTIRTSRELAAHLNKALDCLRCQDARDSLVTYHGSYNRRKIHGQDKWSLHSWGKAIDVNAGLTQSAILVQCFESAGFIWGGRWPKRPDPMHFEIR